MKSQKITLATVKSLINKNAENLYIKLESKFNGMTDGIDFVKDCFTKTESTSSNIKNTLGINGAWFVGSSNDYFTSFENNNFIGVEIYNCCGSFILAIKKQ